MTPLTDFLNRYADEVYGARDPEAARRFIADPCLRHESGALLTMSIQDNVDRIAHFLDSAPDAQITNALIVESGEFATSCYEIDTAQGVVSGIEVFRVVDERIVETWNSVVRPGAWG